VLKHVVLDSNPKMLSTIKYLPNAHQMFLIQPLTLNWRKMVSVKYGLGSSYFNPNKTKPDQNFTKRSTVK
jgi:hypothetical protein